MKDFNLPMMINGDDSLVYHRRLSAHDGTVSPTVVSCDAVTVTSYETTNENGATTLTTSSTTSNSSSSDVAVIVAHRSWTTRATSKKSKDSAIPKAITLKTTTAIPQKKTRLYPTQRTLPSSGSVVDSSVPKLSTAELHQQLQKRLRPEDIPSIPTLSSRRQRRRYNIPSTPTATTVTRANVRPVCTFINYMGTNSQSIHGTASHFLASQQPTRLSYSNPDATSRFGTFPKSLITLHDGNGEIGIGPFDDTHHFASLVTVDESDDDMLLLSNLDTLDWGILPTEVEGMEIGRTDDAFILNESNEAEMMLMTDEPYRLTSTGSSGGAVPIVFGTTANKIKHLDHLETLIDHHTDTALFDSFTLPHCHDDATDLFDFDL